MKLYSKLSSGCYWNNGQWVSWVTIFTVGATSILWGGHCEGGPSNAKAGAGQTKWFRFESCQKR